MVELVHAVTVATNAAATIARRICTETSGNGWECDVNDAIWVAADTAPALVLPNRSFLGEFLAFRRESCLKSLDEAWLL
jgi:hypothetical protein